MRTINEIFTINRDELFKYHNEPIALVYEEHSSWVSNDVNERGVWENTKKIHIYEQVEYFTSITAMKKRQLELSKITNKVYKNFSAIYNKKNPR